MFTQSAQYRLLKQKSSNKLLSTISTSVCKPTANLIGKVLMTLVLNSEDRDKKLSAQIAKDHHHQGTQNLTHTTACIFLHNFWLEIYHYFKPKLILTIFFSPVLPLHHGTILHPEWMGEYLNVVNESSRLLEWSHCHRLGSSKELEMSNCQVSISFCLKYLEYLQN